MKKARKRPNTQEAFTQSGDSGRNTTFFQKTFPNFDQLEKEGFFNWLSSPLPEQGSFSTPSEWAKYASLNAAVADIILWCEYTNFPKGKLSLRDHIVEMYNRKYFVGEEMQVYLKKVIAWENRNVA